MDGAPTVEELSFYDQPDGDAFSTIPLNIRHLQSSDDSDQEDSPRRLRRLSTTSTSSLRSDRSTTSTASAVSTASPTSSCSSVEQVFFGALTDKEKKLVARLSKQTEDLNLHTPPRASQRVGTSNTLKKKDSLEFNRRKTLGFSSRRTVNGGQSRRWEGGLVETTNLPSTSTPLRNVLSSSHGSPADIAHASLFTSPTNNSEETSRVQLTNDRTINGDIGNPRRPLPNSSTPSSSRRVAASARSLADLSLHDSAFLAGDVSSSIFVRLDNDVEGNQDDGRKHGNVGGDFTLPLSLPTAASWSEEHSASESDKENVTAPSGNDATPKDGIVGTTPVPLDLASVLREIPLSGVAERKSLRDRKGDRSGRTDRRNTSSRGRLPLASSASARQECVTEAAVEEIKLVSDGEERIPGKADGSDLGEERITGHSVAEESPSASVRLQAVVAEAAVAQALLPCTSSPQREDSHDAAHSSFDPDSPLPTSRAPRHSLLLALTTSPLKLDETSPTRSPSASPSPAKRELLFAPEYHNVATPMRVRQKPMSVVAMDTPSGQATSRHRLARSLRQEQSMIERQTTISDKLSAISLSMSGMKPSSYGASSTGVPTEVTRKQELLSNTARVYPLQPSPFVSSVKVKKTLPEISTSAVGDAKRNDVTSLTVFEPTPKASIQAEEASQGGSAMQPVAAEPIQSRIPKSVVPPTQPVFRKPAISGLPTLKPSMLPTKLLSASSSATTSKTVTTITMSYKAARPEAGQPHELSRYATPVKGRLPSSLAFRSPAASRVISASNPAKPIQSRNISVNMASSTQGAVRPVTPRKILNRPTKIGEGTSSAPHQETECRVLPTQSNVVASTEAANALSDSLPVTVTAHGQEQQTIPEILEPPVPAILLEAPIAIPSKSDLVALSASKKPTHPTDTQKMDTVDFANSKPEVVGSVLSGKARSTASLLATRRTPTSRATRAVRPIAAAPVRKTVRPAAKTAPGTKLSKIAMITPKELETITALNTSRNEVQYNTIDYKPFKKAGARPPSPKVRTIAEREEEEKKLGREARAKRRGSGRDDQSFDQETTDGPPALADLLPPLKHVRGAGDQEDYQTPARPLKRGRKSGASSGVGEDPSPTAGPKRKKNRVITTKAAEAVRIDRFVRWDKGLIVIDRPEPSAPLHHLGGQELTGVKSCLKNKTSLQLDHLGNFPNATEPVPEVKRTSVVVHQLWYDGENQPVAPARGPQAVTTNAAGSRRGKK